MSFENPTNLTSSMQEQKKSHHEELLTQEWEKSKQNSVIERLQSGENISEIIESVPGFQEAFSQKMDCLDCSDGRVCSGHKLGLAGVGILLSPEEREILVAALKDKNILVTGHENCGAAGMAHPGLDSDKYGYENAKNLAEEVGGPYKEVHKDDFRCAVHNERSLVLDNTGRFDCANWSEFPNQFISSAPFFGLPDSYIKKEVAALAGIALGSHGFGEKFDRNNPFYILISSDSSENLDHLLTVAQEAVAQFGSKVKVDGFVAPAEKE